MNHLRASALKVEDSTEEKKRAHRTAIAMPEQWRLYSR